MIDFMYARRFCYMFICRLFCVGCRVVSGSLCLRAVCGSVCVEGEGVDVWVCVCVVQQMWEELRNRFIVFSSSLSSVHFQPTMAVMS